LPDGTEDQFWEGLQHWCRLLTEVRQLLHGKWVVHVDDYYIKWDSVLNMFDPSV